MPRPNTATSRKSQPKSKRRTSKTRRAVPKQSLIERARSALKDFLSRRPHRSFRLTRRRDYVRSLELPGYIAFTRQAWGEVWAHRGTFLKLVFFFTLFNIIFVGISSPDTYRQLSQTLDESGKNLFSGALGEVGKATLLLAGETTGGFASGTTTDVGRVYGVLMILLAWLTTVWLLRGFLAGQRPKLRDGLYSAGAPIVATGMVSLLLVVQGLPILLAWLGVVTLQSTTLLDSGGLLLMLVSFVVILLSVVSLYFLTSTFFALIIVTLPGMYPWQALRTAGDLVQGRRFRLLLRLIWMGVLLILMWSILMILIILIDKQITTWLPWFANLQLVSIMLPFVSIAAFVMAASYVYLLYRKVVEDDSAPA